MMSLATQSGYTVPSYRAPEDEPWFHFLHGNVPGHQIDFMYRAEVPQGRLTRQHFSHLSRLMKYIEPQTNFPFAFAIGNLSRDDTQHEPGHGGLALIFGLRIRGATDHAGRQDPPFSHGIAVIDRELDADTILSASCSFHRHVFGAAASAEWYRAYVRCALEAPADVPGVLAGYVTSFDDLPRPAESGLTTRWLASATTPKRVVIVHPDDASFDEIARCASRIAAMLYPSDIRWTAISNGREADVPNGVSIRFVAESALSIAEEALGPRRLVDVPEDEAGIARELFGASPAVKAKPAAKGWRERYSALGESGTLGGSADGSVDVPVGRSSWEGHAPVAHTRSERPPPRYAPPAAVAVPAVAVAASAAAPAAAVAVAAATAPASSTRESVEVETGFESVPVDDLDGETHAWPHRRSTPVPVEMDRGSVDDEAVTVGAPMQRDPPSNGVKEGAASVDVEVQAEGDGGGRSASFDLLPPAAVAEKPSGDGQETVTAGFQRETVQLSPEHIKRTLAQALPFRPAEPTPTPATSTIDKPWRPDEVPNFRASPLRSWKWVLVLAVTAGVVFLAAYLMSAPQPPPSVGSTLTAETATAAPMRGVAAAPTVQAAATASAAPTARAAPTASAAPSTKKRTQTKSGATPNRTPPTREEPPPPAGGAFNPNARPVIDESAPQ